MEKEEGSSLTRQKRNSRRWRVYTVDLSILRQKNTESYNYNEDVDQLEDLKVVGPRPNTAQIKAKHHISKRWEEPDEHSL